MKQNPAPGGRGFACLDARVLPQYGPLDLQLVAHVLAKQRRVLAAMAAEGQLERPDYFAVAPAGLLLLRRHQLANPLECAESLLLRLKRRNDKDMSNRRKHVVD